MTDYALLLANPIADGQLSFKAGTARAETLRLVSVGDLIVPLVHCGAPSDGISFIIRVAHAAVEVVDNAGQTVVRVEGDTIELDEPLGVQDFLRLRLLDEPIAAAFQSTTPPKAMMEAQGSLAAAVLDAGNKNRDETSLFRRFSLVSTQDPADAARMLEESGRSPLPGDGVFMFTNAAMTGAATVDAAGKIVPRGQPIGTAPSEVLADLFAAQARVVASDSFHPEPVIAALEQVVKALQEQIPVVAVDDYVAYYPFTKVLQTLNTALPLLKRPIAPDDDGRPATSATPAGDAVNIAGLTVEAVLAELPDGFKLQREVVAAAVTALRAGKHLLLGGPPGTGKTTLAEALCRAVVGSNYSMTTATADWTTFDTIGGYLPDEGGLRFTPGVVLRSLRNAGWLVIDEVNRADIDKAFGPLFTVLSGGDDAAGRTSVLPYQTPDGPVTIKWTDKVEDSASVYPLTSSWRLIGTLNVSDKTSLFRLSFAFLRRFAVIDVPLPDAGDYEELLKGWYASAGVTGTDALVEAGIALAQDGPIQIGPAISADITAFVAQGVAQTSSDAAAFENPETAFLVGVRLFVVPQYEGQPESSGEQLVKSLGALLPSADSHEFDVLRAALKDVALK